MDYLNATHARLMNPLSDTCLFLFGASISIVLDYNLQTLYKYMIETQERNRDRVLLFLGILQLLLISIVIETSNSIFKKLGLFTLGLLGFQTLYMKELYDVNLGTKKSKPQPIQT